MRITQAIDVIEAQSMQRPIRDEPPDERMDCVECAAVFDAQSGQRVDVEKSAVVNLVAGKAPMREPIMLALEQVVQGKDSIRSAGRWAVGPQPAFDHLVCARNRSQIRLEDACRLTRRIMRPTIALHPFQKLAACKLLARACLCPDFLQDLAIAVGRNGQPMLEVPGGE